MPETGLIVSVYRDSHRGSDCTNGGVSSRFDEFVLIDPEGEITGPFEPKEDRPAIYLVRRFLFGDTPYLSVSPRDCAHLRHYGKEWGGSKQYSFGGNFVYTSDSRMRCVGNDNKSPIPIHDRREF